MGNDSPCVAATNTIYERHMTTIAFDGKTLAADSLAVYNGVVSNRNAKKIRRVDGNLFALTGTPALFDAFVEWYIGGAKPADVPKCQDNDDNYTRLIVIKSDGRCFQYMPAIPYADELCAPFAWGSGSQIALGAMMAGCDAVGAIKVAIEVDVCTGGDVVSESLVQ